MAKLKVLLHSVWYPMAMATYFRRALERRDDIDLKVVGIYTGQWIPWGGGMTLPFKYAIPPDVIIPTGITPRQVDYEWVKAQLDGWTPDLVLTVDADQRTHWKSKPLDGVVAHVGTDPHVLSEQYKYPRSFSDKFFNMQKVYSVEGDSYLPYAYDPTVHYENPEATKDYDVSMIGLQYPNRITVVEKLRKEGIKVLFELGVIMDEYRQINNRAHIGINWSSLDDLNARAFEIPQMGQIEIMNPVTDRKLHKCFDNVRTFTTVDEAVRQVKEVLDNLEESKRIAEGVKQVMKDETYDVRVQQILDECGFGE